MDAGEHTTRRRKTKDFMASVSESIRTETLITEHLTWTLAEGDSPPVSLINNNSDPASRQRHTSKHDLEIEYQRVPGFGFIPSEIRKYPGLNVFFQNEDTGSRSLNLVIFP
jgi:hypothetical protein